MIVGRLIGAVIFLVGLGVLVRDILVLADTGYWAPLSFGAWWYDIDPPSLALAQAAIERALFPALWDPVITTLLMCWVSLALLLVGGAVFALCRTRPRRRFAA